MNSNRLKMNSEKTEFIMFGNKPQVEKCAAKSIQVVDSEVRRNDVIKYLGVYLDRGLSFQKQVAEKCRIAAMNIHYIRQIRQYLSKEATQQLMCSLVVSHLDYANSLLVGLPAKTVQRLQRIQNMAAKLTLKLKKYDSATEALYSLHWLPIAYRCEFKVACLVHKTLSGNGPAYFESLLVPHVAGYSTRSAQSDAITLEVPRTRHMTFADRSFSVAAPRIWNALPASIKVLKDLDKFKKDLKTFLFKKAFGLK